MSIAFLAAHRALLAVLALTLHAGPAAADGAPLPTSMGPPAHVRRGDEVEARYRPYRARLERFFEALGGRLEGEAPDLHEKLKAAPPEPLPHGYQVLPRLVPDPPPKPAASRIASASYSWRRTESFIERDLGRLEKVEARLEATVRSSGEDRRSEWRKLVDEYRTLAANQKLIASHIEYNRFWQGEIARHRGGYDVQTSLYDCVFERQALLEALQAVDELIEPELRGREQALFARIYEATHRVSPPDFLSIEQPSPRRWTFGVTVYTDIEDGAFVDAFRSAVESAWRVVDGDDEFSVAVEVRQVTASALYPDGARPAHGAHIDMESHIRRFPPRGAVLTTGTNNTHVLGRAINLGPQDITPNVLAHEFGHILGFGDGYFRGYRDRGPEGFEVLEVVIEPDDFMSAPGAGPVGRQRFQHLLDARGRSR